MTNTNEALGVTLPLPETLRSVCEETGESEIRCFAESVPVCNHALRSEESSTHCARPLGGLDDTTRDG
jgi:hypothetical protein